MSETETEETIATTKPGAPVLTPEERDEIRRLVGEGELKPIACARKFGVSPAAISHILAKEPKLSFGCLKLAREEEARAAVKAAETAKAVSFAELRLQRIEDTKTSLYQTNVAIAAAFQKKLKEHIAGRIVLSVKELRGVQAGIAQNRQERYAILNAEKEIDANELPEIVIRDLTEDEILAMQNADELELGEEDAVAEIELIP